MYASPDVFTDPLSLFRRLPARQTLLWLLLVAGVVLLWLGPPGLRQAGLIAAAIGAVAAVAEVLWGPRGNSAASEFRTALLLNAVLSPFISLILIPVLALAWLILGIRQGFDAPLLLGVVKMYALLLWSGYVISLPGLVSRMSGVTGTGPKTAEPS